MTPPLVLVGLPYSQDGRLSDEAAALNAPIMISMGSHYRANRGGIQALGQVVRRHYGRVALDSAGFVAMKAGGYQWDVADYVDFVRTAPTAGGVTGWGGQGSPWLFWSSMDFCVEAEIAGDQAEVDRRVELTASTLGEILEEVDYWRDVEGDLDLTDPLPILQGQSIADYVRSVELTARVLAAHGREWPELVGLGSVCRRDVDGDEGLLELLRALDEVLPQGVRLHLFGVKGELLGRLDRALLERVASVDSMAWDFRARKEARAARISNTVEHRAGWLRDWYQRQTARLAAALAALPSTSPAPRPIQGAHTRTENPMNLHVHVTLDTEEAERIDNAARLAGFALATLNLTSSAALIATHPYDASPTPDGIPLDLSLARLEERRRYLVDLHERLVDESREEDRRIPVVWPSNWKEAGVAGLIHGDPQERWVSSQALGRFAYDRLAQVLTWLNIDCAEALEAERALPAA